MEQKEVWLENVQKLIENCGLSYKKIADRASVSEQTVARIATARGNFAKNTGLHTLISIVNACGGSIIEVIEGTNVQIVGPEILQIQSQIEILKAELNTARTDLSVLKNSNAALLAENELLRLKLAHKEEIIAHKEQIIALMSHYDKISHPES